MLLGSGCVVPVAEKRDPEQSYWASRPFLVEKPGVVTTIPLPPRDVQNRAAMDFTPIFATVGVSQTAVSAAKSSEIDRTKTNPAAAVCATISECDGQEYDLLVISQDQTAEAVGRAAYCVILWNKAGIDWHAEIWFDVSWESAKKPFATVVYRNTKEDSCLFVENGSSEGSWKVVQEMKFGRGAPTKEHVSKARPLASFPRHKLRQAP
jgi:hypothetical protein